MSARRILSTEVLEWEKTPKQNTFRRIHHSSRTSRQNLCTEIIKVYMTDFFICSIKSPHCTDMYRKEKFSIAIFLPRVLSNFTSGGVQNCGAKNKRLGTIVTSFQDSKLCKKQISLTFSYFLINNAILHHFLAN